MGDAHHLKGSEHKHSELKGPDLKNPDLKTRGLKATLPRLRVLQLFESQAERRHLSAEEV